MRIRHCCWTLFAAVHLLIVVSGAGGWLPDRCGGPLASVLLWHASMSGADSYYGFYAPDVGDEFRARFRVEDGQGFTWQDTFEQTRNPETRLRLGGIALHAFANSRAEESPQRRERLIKSWAAAMFTRHPGAVSVTVVVETYDVPTLSEYRAGQQPRWNVVYEAKVQRDAHSAGGTEP